MGTKSLGELIINNPIISAGLMGITGGLSDQEAVQSIQDNVILRNSSDELLMEIVLEAVEYWRESIESNSNTPQISLGYPFLAEICIEARLETILEYLKGASENEKSEVEARADYWIAALAAIRIKKGMTALIIPDPELAFKLFDSAYSAAKGEPDLGRKRCWLILSALNGMRLATIIGEQPDLCQRIEAEMTQLATKMRIEPQEDAELHAIKAEYDWFQNILRQYMLNDIENREQPVASPQPQDKPFQFQYQTCLNDLGNQVLSGEISLETAKQHLLEDVDLSLVEPSVILIIAQIHMRLAFSLPDLAVVLSELNSFMADHIPNKDAGLLQAYCVFVLGDTLTIRARQHQDEAIGFQRAIPFLERALNYFHTSHEPAHRAFVSRMLVQLGLCMRGVGQFDRAEDFFRQYIRHLELYPEDPGSVGVAYGNLGDVLEIQGDFLGGYTNHYRALQIFLQVGDRFRSQQALHYIMQMCKNVGLIDDALAAMKMAASFNAERANIEEAAANYYYLGQLAYRAHNLDDAWNALTTAYNLLVPHIPNFNIDEIREGDELKPELVSLYINCIVWLVALLAYLYNHAPHLVDCEEVSEALESARYAATYIQDAERMSSVLLQEAEFTMVVGRDEWPDDWPVLVQNTLKWLTAFNDNPILTARGNEIQGNVLLIQMRYADAIPYLENALTTYLQEFEKDPDFMRLVSVNQLLGNAYEGLGQTENSIAAYEEAIEKFEQQRVLLNELTRMSFMNNATQVYDRLIVLHVRKGFLTRALYWLEKRKSRTFVEALGLAPFLYSPGEREVDPLRQEEQAILRDVNQLRNKILDADEDLSHQSLSVQRQLLLATNHLHQIWIKIAESDPEYVEMRRGDVVDWNDLQQILHNG